jgi:hypothetical protein
VFRVLFDIQGKKRYGYDLYGGTITLGRKAEKKISEYLKNEEYEKLYKYLVKQVKKRLKEESDQFGIVSISIIDGKRDFFDINEIKKITVETLFRLKDVSCVGFDLAENKKTSLVSKVAIPVIRYS